MNERIPSRRKALVTALNSYVNFVPFLAGFKYRESYAVLWRVISIKLIILLPNAAECACELQLSRTKVLSY